MKYKEYLEETHRDINEKVLKNLYEKTETAELQKILKKFRQCKTPDSYMLICIRAAENELLKREKNRMRKCQ